MKQILTRAHDELFRRAPDESFATLPDLWQHCFDSRQRSELLWRHPQELAAMPAAGRIELATGQTDTRRLNSWSFGQLCQLAGVNRERTAAGTGEKPDDLPGNRYGPSPLCRLHVRHERDRVFVEDRQSGVLQSAERCSNVLTTDAADEFAQLIKCVSGLPIGSQSATTGDEFKARQPDAEVA